MLEPISNKGVNIGMLVSWSDETKLEVFGPMNPGYVWKKSNEVHKPKNLPSLQLSTKARVLYFREVSLGEYYVLGRFHCRSIMLWGGFIMLWGGFIGSIMLWGGFIRGVLCFGEVSLQEYYTLERFH